MEVKEKKTVDMLTPDGVSIMTSQLVSLDGEMVQIGEPHRRAYANSLSGNSGKRAGRCHAGGTCYLGRFADYRG